MVLFNYDLEKLREEHISFMIKLKKFKNIGDGTPKVYFILNKTTNEVFYIGSCKVDVFLRLSYHFNEAICIASHYLVHGSVRQMSNNFLKVRTLCDIVYNNHEIDVVIFGKYETLEKAELVEKALIFNSNSPYLFNICNTVGVKKLSTKAIKNKI